VFQSSEGKSGSAGIEVGPSAVTTPGAVAFFGAAKTGGLSLSVGYAVARKGRAIVLVTSAGPGTQTPAFDTYLKPILRRLSPLG
jgi:hypothetical protein